MECIVSFVTIILLTVAAEAVFWRFFTGVVKKRILARAAENPGHDFTKDTFLRFFILFWISVAGGLIVAGGEISMQYCPSLQSSLRIDTIMKHRTTTSTDDAGMGVGPRNADLDGNVACRVEKKVGIR